MATASISYPSSKERTNYAKLCRAIVDLCTEILRDVLKTIAIPAGLRTKISTCDELKSRSHKLDAGQWKIVNTAVSSNSYKEFDISLLYKLIRAFSVQEMRDKLATFIPPNQILLSVQGCPGLQPLLNQVQMKTIQYSSSNGSYSECDCFLLSLLIQHLHSSYKPKILPSAKKWGDNSVLNTNVTYGDDIERIRIMRNRVYGHISDTLVTDSEFNDHWVELDGIMMRMDVELATTGRYKKDLVDIENACMDDKLEKYFMSEIQRFVENEKNITAELKEHGSDIENVKRKIQSTEEKSQTTSEKTAKLEGKLQKTEEKSQATSEKTAKLEEKLQKTEEKSQATSEKTAKLEEKLQKTEEKSQATSEKTAKLEEKLQKTEEKSQATSEKTAKLKEKLQKTEEKSQATSEKTAKLEEKLQKTEEKSQATSEKTAKLEEKLQKTEEKSQATSEKTAKLEEKLQKTEEKSQATSEKTAKLEEKLQNTEEKSQANSEKTAKLEEKLQKTEEKSQATSEKTAKLEEKLQNTEEKSQANSEKTAKLEEKLQKTEEKSQATSEKTAKLEEKLQNTEEKSQANSEKTAKLEEKLQKTEEKSQATSEKTAKLEEKLQKTEEKSQATSEKTAKLEEKLHKTEILYEMRQTGKNPSDLVPENIREQMRIRIEEWKSAKYVEVQASATVSKDANTNTVVTVTGNPGMGKSATIHHVAMELASKGFDVLPVDSVKEIKKYLHPAFKQVFVLDDPVGVHSLDEDELGKWVKFNSTLKCLSVANTKILCSIRKTVVSEFNFKVSDTVLNKNIIDIQDSQNLLKEDEKLKILEQHLKGKQYRISDEMRAGISKIMDYFPLICKLFASDEKFRNLGLKFFLEPFRIIKNELDGMFCEDKFSYCVLVLCFLENNSLPLELFDPFHISKSKRNFVEDVSECCGLSRNSPLSNFKEKLRKLETVFLQREGDRYKFVHDTINDVVAYHFGLNYPAQIIKKTTSKFISERIVVCQDHVSTNDKHAILLDKQYFPVLLERLLDDIRGGKYYHVFKNKCWDDSIFMESFIEMCSEQREKTTNYVVAQDIVPLFCGSVEKYEDSIDSELEHTKADDQWTWYFSAMLCLQTRSISLLHWVVTFAHKELFEFIWNNLSLNQKKNIIDKVPLIHFACLGGDVDICRKLLQIESKKINTPLEGNIGEIPSLLPLHYAAMSSPHVIDLLIDHGAEVNAKSSISGGAPILYAAALGNYDTVIRLISYNADIKIRDSENCSSLWFSCQNGHEDVCNLLICHGADISLCDIDGMSPLFSSCQSNRINIVQLLLNHGADINLCRNDGISPLFMSCQENHINIVQLLLDHGADINLCKNDGGSPLIVSCRKNHINIIQLLLNHGADINLCKNDGLGPLFISCEVNHINIVQLLLDHDTDINLCMNDGASPLFVSCQENHINIVQLLLHHGADINLCMNDGGSPLFMSCQKNHINIVQLLLDHDADINLCMNDGASPLFVSCQENHINIVQLLLDHDADINLCMNNGASPLFVSCQENHINIVQLLLHHGADINLCRNDGGSPLFMSCQKNHINIVQLLLDHDADINLCMNDGASPLFMSCQENHINIVQLLLHHGADVNICTKWGATALIIACNTQNAECTKLLLDTGKCLIDHQDEDGDTALISAVEADDTKSTELLIKHGCDINIRNNDGKTALDLARDENNHGAVQLLKDTTSNK